MVESNQVILFKALEGSFELLRAFATNLTFLQLNLYIAKRWKLVHTRLQLEDNEQSSADEPSS